MKTGFGLGGWERLRVQQKVWIVVLVLSLPLLAALVFQVTLIQQLRTLQEHHQQTRLVRDQIRILARLSVDIEDAFRGYLLTEQDKFLEPMQEAESRLKPTITRTVDLAEEMPDLSTGLREIGKRLYDFTESKRALIRKVRVGRAAEVLQYVRSGEGLVLSSQLLREIRAFEDRLTLRIQSFKKEEEDLAHRAFWGLLLAVVGGLALGVFSARVLTRSITGPLTLLNSSVARLGEEAASQENVTLPIYSSDEIGQLARSYEEMAGRIRRHIRELEALNAIGNEINSIGPDGLHGVLRRITDRAAEMLHADVCLVMLRDERMGCWVVEAASGGWHEKLHKTVMLWDEFPIAVRSYETGRPAVGENLRNDIRPEMVRRNLLGESLMAIPLLAQGKPFGVLVLLQERQVREEDWNLRLAKGFADEAAIAISNARLLEATQQRRKGLELRLKQLEHLAETLAHDMKAPGERMEGLSALLLSKFGKGLDPEAARLLRLIQESGRGLSERIETILEVSRLGAGLDAVEAVDPAPVIGDVLKARAGELEAGRVRVHVDRELPMVACHRAYLCQVFDNLISNAVKFSRDRPDPEIRVEAVVKGDRVHFSVRDNGCGIPPHQRERVFESFVRLNPSSFKGTGIGLTIVQRIVELYGGEVWVQPEGLPGCTVMFTLPVLGDLSAGRPCSNETDEAVRPGWRKPHG